MSTLRVLRSLDGVSLAVHHLHLPALTLPSTGSVPKVSSLPPIETSLPTAISSTKSTSTSTNKRVVFSHATGFHGRMFNQTMQHLVPDFHCMSIDHRGHGLTRYEEDKQGHDSWEMFGDDMLTITDDTYNDSGGGDGRVWENIGTYVWCMLCCVVLHHHHQQQQCVCVCASTDCIMICVTSQQSAIIHSTADLS